MDMGKKKKRIDFYDGYASQQVNNIIITTSASFQPKMLPRVSTVLHNFVPKYSDYI